MKEVIRSIILRLFPELNSKKHLPAFGVITAIADAPDQERVSDYFRPYYAVNIKLLDEYLNIDDKQPEIEAVPLTISGGGMEKGIINYPQPGTVVEIAFGYGKLSLPFIRSCLPYRLSLSGFSSDSVRLQNSWSSLIDIDRAGNISNKTNSNIISESYEEINNCINKVRTISNEITDVTGVSYKKVYGIFERIAGAIKLISTGSSHYGSAFNTNITSGQNLNSTAGQNFNNIAGQGVSFNAGQSQEYKAPKNYIGSKNENLFQLVSEFMSAVIDCFTVLSSHTHPLVAAIDQSAAVKSDADKIAAQKGRLDPIIK